MTGTYRLISGGRDLSPRAYVFKYNGRNMKKHEDYPSWLTWKKVFVIGITTGLILLGIVLFGIHMVENEILKEDSSSLISQ